MRLPESFRSLRSREFRAFFGAQTISQIATWMLSVAQAGLILSLTNSPLRLGLINLLHWGPILLLAILLGLLHASAAAGCAVLLALSIVEVFWLAAIGMFLLGHAGVITAARCNTALQLGSSDGHSSAERPLAARRRKGRHAGRRPNARGRSRMGSRGVASS